MSSAGAIAAIVTAMAAVIAVGGGYVQFVLKRSLPSVEFDIDFQMHHSGSTQLIGEVSCVIKISDRAC